MHNPYNWTREHLHNVLFEGKTKVTSNESIVNAFKNIDRANFVSEENENYAYADQNIDIGFGQTIEKPTTIALQLDVLDPRENGRYLHIGAGSGFVSALLGHIVGEHGKVIALERILMLTEQIHKNLKNYPMLQEIVEPVFKDGYYGYAGKAPYDGILISASYETIPNELIEQLKIGGKVVAPIKKFQMKVITKISLDKIVEENFSMYLPDEMTEGVE